MYSNRSDACRINDGYKTGDFDRVIDIFTTKKASTATCGDSEISPPALLADLPSCSLIQSQFNSVNYNYTRFNPKLLNESAAAVNASLALNAHDISPFVIANLRAWNATGTEAPNDPGSAPTPVPIANDNNGGGLPSNGLAMIILYVITGSVSALFLIVILTGVSTFWLYNSATLIPESRLCGRSVIQSGTGRVLMIQISTALKEKAKHVPSG